MAPTVLSHKPRITLTGMGLQKEPSSYERQLVALGRALQALREEETTEGLVKLTLDYLRAEFDYSLIWLGLYERMEHRMVGMGGTVPTPDASFLRQRIQLNPGDLLEQVVIQQRPIGVPDLREEPRAGDWRKAAQKFNIQGTIIFPIRHKEHCFGVVLLGSPLWGTSPHAEEKARLSMLLGGLAEAFYHLQAEHQRRQLKRPEDPLLQLLTVLRSLPTFQQRLEAIIEETHRFLAPDRTNVYWYEPQQRYFWRRMGHRDKRDYTSSGEKSAETFPVQEINSFYQSLSADQLVSIGEAHSSLKTDVTGRLMQQIQARSLVAAPIVFQGDLKGFLAVEGNEPRIWSEEEKRYLRGVAQLLALTSPLEETEKAIQQIKLDQELTAELSHALYNEEDWKAALNVCAAQLSKRLGTERFIVALYNTDLKKFEICYQHQPKNRRPIASPLEPLNPVDWQMLERNTEAIGIENLGDDLKLLAWRQPLLAAETRSLLVCSTSIGKPLEGIVIVAHEATRSWSRAERELVRVVSQQVGLLLHQWHLQQQMNQLHKTYQAVQWGLTSMQQMHQLESLEQAATQQIAQLLQVPLATLITWQPGRTVARLTTPVVSTLPFGVTEIPIPIYTDLLIQQALQTDGLATLAIDEISPETRQWLSGSEIGRIMAMTLRTSPDHEPTAILLVADVINRHWTATQLSAMGTLVSQLAWCRRYLLLTETLLEHRQTLEQLNWYKQHRLEEVYRILSVGVRRLNELSHQKIDGSFSVRYQQILRHLSNTLTSMTPVLKREPWQFRNEYETIPLASLIKRSLERVDALIKQRQLWSQVHTEANVSIGGDVSKLEYVMYEVLVNSCHRAPTGSRLDIWCRQIDPHWIEVSITDNGRVEPRLIEELELGRSMDALAPSTLDQPPGLHLAICQSLLQKLGGEFMLQKLEDERMLSRLIVPIATEGISRLRDEAEVSSFF